MFAPAFWWRPRPCLSARLLQPLAWAYGHLSTLHRKQQLKNPYFAAVPVISIGNITVGGTGKTPLTLWLARHFATQGHQVAIISRGYGGAETRYPQMLNLALHQAWQVGDEPLLLAHATQGSSVQVWVGRNRPATVRRAEQAGATLILLDDGFQRADVARTVNILAINGHQGFGNGLCLPAGPLREPLSALSRATFAIVINPPADDTATYHGLPAYRLHMVPTPATLKPLQGKPVFAFAGLAQPEKFFHTLRHAGLNVTHTMPFPDHHTYTEADLQKLTTLANAHGATLATTTKDAPKLPPHFAHIVEVTLSGPDIPNILEEITEHLR